MAHHKPASELQTILDIVLEHPDGIGISALENALAQRLGKPMIRRTLQRKLHRLIADQQLGATGKSVSLEHGHLNQQGSGRGVWYELKS